MPKTVHVLFNKSGLSGDRLQDKVVVVLDVVFATTTIVTALAHGARDVVPAKSPEDALQMAVLAENAPYVLAGESQTERIPGFATPHPLELVAHGVADKTVIYATTNGTVALGLAQGAAHVYAAGIVNAGATARHIAREHPGSTVLVTCAGVGDSFNLEDMIGAGHVVNALQRGAENAVSLTDAALAAQALAMRWDPTEALMASRVGRMMVRHGLEAEVRHAARLDSIDLVAPYRNGRIAALRADC
jgi:2-phosphosulfolactate phosphatase